MKEESHPSDLNFLRFPVAAGVNSYPSDLNFLRFPVAAGVNSYPSDLNFLRFPVAAGVNSSSIDSRMQSSTCPDVKMTPAVPGEEPLPHNFPVSISRRSVPAFARPLSNNKVLSSFHAATRVLVLALRRFFNAASNSNDASWLNFGVDMGPWGGGLAEDPKCMLARMLEGTLSM